jgi:hypothetical protein
LTPGEDEEDEPLLTPPPPLAPLTPAEAAFHIALETASFAWLGSTRVTLARSVTTMPVSNAIWRTRFSGERRRARRLGLSDASAPPPPPARVPLDVPGPRVPVFLSLPPSGFLAMKWHEHLASLVAAELVRCYDWRRAGG